MSSFVARNLDIRIQYFDLWRKLEIETFTGILFHSARQKAS